MGPVGFRASGNSEGSTLVEDVGFTDQGLELRLRAFFRGLLALRAVRASRILGSGFRSRGSGTKLQFRV